jgi:hypothetical protein
MEFPLKSGSKFAGFPVGTENPKHAGIICMILQDGVGKPLP